MIEIDPCTGLATSVGSTGIQSPDLAFDTAGTLYAWYEYNKATGNSDNLGTVNLSTGAFTQISSNNSNTWATGISFNANNQCYLKDGDEIHAFNHVTGFKTSSVSISGSTNNLLAFHKNDVCYTGQRTGAGFVLKTINVSTGALTNIGTAPVSGISAIAFDNMAISQIQLGGLTFNNPGIGQSNGSINIRLCGLENQIRYSRWSKKDGINYPEGTELKLDNANAGSYTLMIITTDKNIHYLGPYSLSN